ncbi:Smr/MutS family protein [Wenzhouxiangella limi]|nr:Smr/MutS family protein [Wenzhouxiangella limi]
MTIADDERELFRAEIGSVRRVRSERDRSRPDAPRPVPAQRRRDELAVIDELATAPVDFSQVETGEEISYLRPGLQRRLLTRLRRGHWRVQDELDLHQMNVAAASQSMRLFLDHARRSGLSCVKIIHGKGLRSGPDGPQLKRLAAGLLARHSAVCAFASAPPKDGGTGAVYILLDH